MDLEQPRPGTWRAPDGPPCRGCGYGPMDAASSLKGHPAPPAADDLAVCPRCGTLALYTGRGLELRPPSEAEELQLAQLPEVRRLRAAVARLAIDP